MKLNKSRFNARGFMYLIFKYIRMNGSYAELNNNGLFSR